MVEVIFKTETFKQFSSSTVVIFTDAELNFSAQVGALVAPAKDHIQRAAQAAKFGAKANATLEIIAPQGLALERLILISTGKAEDQQKWDALKAGAAATGAIPTNAETCDIVLDLPVSCPSNPEITAKMELGARLRAYKFDRYKTKRKEGDEEPQKKTITLLVTDQAAHDKAAEAQRAIANGVVLARDLVHEPCNVLYPAEFSQRIEALRDLGVEVEILDKNQLEKIGMRALLAVAQGSVREARVAIMRWNGGKQGDAPLALVGKGVTFDTGGISIKPGQGMEDMKADMGGAAAVVGAMAAIAGRKAKANVVAAVGLVENMPDGNAYRPGDILTSLSGQTIEVINTDAEGRLVLCDVLWYMQERFKPVAMVNLATLTGAILVALAQEYAGLFSNNDELAEKITKAGQTTGERAWRMPMGPEFDKMIDSKFADMKNTGGRFGGSITAAQFLARFVNNVPWAHIDIAGVAMDSPASDLNKSWASGFGVRLLNELVQTNYEQA